MSYFEVVEIVRMFCDWNLDLVVSMDPFMCFLDAW